MEKEFIKVNNERYRLGYHVMASNGWINDPNGFVYFQGYYHIFYQHHPYSAKWGPMHWGHARSKDLVHWETLPIALTPGDVEDQDGCFSGSAIVKDDTLYLFYTGHHYYGDNDPDHFWQNQNMAYSKDGIHFTKYEHNPVIAKEPADNTHHFRDPKVWEQNGVYYMILGSQENDGLGRVIVYRSKDLLNWDYVGPMTKAKSLAKEGFMWECPDFFELDGSAVLLLSPQGIEACGKEYLNLFQTGYFVGTLNESDMTYTHKEFKELDRGHDFYATQTTQAPDGRRLVFGWMDMWESDMPEQADGWAGALTLPRELSLKNGHLYMKPARELIALRQEQESDTVQTVETKLEIASALRHHELVFDFEQMAANTAWTLSFETNIAQVITLSYEPKNRELILRRNDNNEARYGTIQEEKVFSCQVFIDTSSIEIFLNDGETVFTERYYSEVPLACRLTVDQKTTIAHTVYALESEAITYI
ncbi:sucrose-6-phosphate hydrolase [uncultured Enterococcus sp.]|uniref:glycoside hydrolase family 32 protein n=1 Tax=uncultured Enterococcus sp. TaxID=167972 RepID=UPI0025FBC36F|nr:sucrose-6-phosphate hydrolase [uncultured Enterococcus sp.]